MKPLPFLQEIATLLRRKVEQHDEIVQRGEKIRQRFGERGGFITSVGTMREERGRRRDEVQAQMEKNREESAKHREEDRHFKERLLAELERHNHLIESLLARLGRS
jgi:hypothetical protein